jgi:hypothetical protein
MTETKKKIADLPFLGAQCSPDSGEQQSEGERKRAGEVEECYEACWGSFVVSQNCSHKRLVR